MVIQNEPAINAGELILEVTRTQSGVELHVEVPDFTNASGHYKPDDADLRDIAEFVRKILSDAGMNVEKMVVGVV